MVSEGMVDQQKAVGKHIRGSSMLMVGRFIALAVNFLVQVITVRYLTKSDYGAFVYALTIASIGATFALWSMDKALLRFLPTYDENKDNSAQRGTILLTLGMVAGASLALVILIHGLQGLISDRFVDDPISVSLLLIVIFTSPVSALDHWFQSLFAVFASAKSIFFRRHILGPGLKLTAVLAVVILQADVYALAWGYVIGGLIGLLTYGTLLRRMFSKWEVFRTWNWRQMRFPVREIYGYSTLLMYADLAFILRNNVILIIVEAFHGLTSVAEYRAVDPVARLNSFVFQSFTFLYTPLAARIHARADKDSITDLYWRTALWITVFSFPMFIVTFSLSTSVTVLLFEERYASSAPILAVLSLGYYFNAALGFNAYTLRVYGVTRYLAVIDFLAAICAVVLSLLLIPPYGAMGAAFSAMGTLVIHNLLNHLGLMIHTEIPLFDWRYLKSYVMVSVAAIGMLVYQLVVDAPLLLNIVFGGLVSLLILYLNRRQLKVAETFPELLRFKVLGKLLGP